MAEARKALDFEDELKTYPLHSLIISSEMFFLNRQPARYQAFLNMISDCDVELIGVLRDQYSWAASRYAENVMGGRSTVETMPHFMDAMISTGEFDYHRVLGELSRIFGARKVRAIPFEDPGGPLVPRFLAELGIPVTDPAAAQTIHANRQTRPPEMLEARRRLNPLIFGFPVEDKWGFEAQFRKLIPPADLPGPALALPDPAGSLDADQLAAIRRSNARLVKSGVMDSPIDLPEPSPPAETGAAAPHRWTPAVEWLYRRGLEILPGVAGDKTGSAIPADAELLVAIAAILDRYPVSLHVQSEWTARLAAAREDRVILLLLEMGRPLWRTAQRLDALPTPSPILALGIGQAPMIWGDAPYALILGAGADIAPVAQTVITRPPQVIILPEGGAEALPAGLARDYESAPQGDALILTRRGPGAGPADPSWAVGQEAAADPA